MSDSKRAKVLCKARALYLGCSIPSTAAVGIEAVQDPLAKLYPKNLKAIKAIDVFIIVYQNGLKIDYVQSSTHQGEWYPMANLYVAAAIKHDAKKTACGYSFAPLDNPVMKRSNAPPVFAAIYRRPKGRKVLECHAFICQKDSEAQELVNACTSAYKDKDGWNLPAPIQKLSTLQPKIEPEDDHADYTQPVRRKDGTVSSRTSQAVHEFGNPDPVTDVVNVTSDFHAHSYYSGKERTQGLDLSYKDASKGTGSPKASPGSIRSSSSAASPAPELPPRRYQDFDHHSATSKSAHTRPSPMVFQAPEDVFLRSADSASRGTWRFPPHPALWYGPPQPLPMHSAIPSQSVVTSSASRDSQAGTSRGFPMPFPAPMYYGYPFPVHSPPGDDSRENVSPVQFPHQVMPFYSFYPPSAMSISLQGTIDSRARPRTSPHRKLPYSQHPESPQRMEQSPAPRSPDYNDDYVNRRPDSPIRSLRDSTKRARDTASVEMSVETDSRQYSASFPHTDTDREWFTEDEPAERS